MKILNVATHNNPLKIWWNVLARIAVWYSTEVVYIVSYDLLQRLSRVEWRKNKQPETEWIYEL